VFWERAPGSLSDQETAFVAPPTIQIGESQSSHPTTQVQSQHAQPQIAVVQTPPAPTFLTTPAEIADAIATCGKGAVEGTLFSTTLSIEVSDDGKVQRALFTPPLLPGAHNDEARDCAANVIYKRTRLTPGTMTVPIQITR